MFIGFGTVVNVLAVLAESAIGVLVGHWLPERTRSVVTDGLGLVTLLIGGLSAVAVTDPALAAPGRAGLVRVGGVRGVAGLGRRRVCPRGPGRPGVPHRAWCAVGKLRPRAHLLAVTATGGVLLAGVALRSLRVKAVPVGDLLPGLLVAPLLVELWTLLG